MAKLAWGSLLLIPLSLALAWNHADARLVFLCSGLAIIPLAGWMGKATESLATRIGQGWGGFLNATFGNAAELILGFLALRQGMLEVVQASLTGSILGNILLVLGMAEVVGGIRHPIQKFSSMAAETGAAMLALAVAGMTIPAVYHHAHPLGASSTITLSRAIAIILLILYLLSLIFQFVTHKDIFGANVPDQNEKTGWKKPLFILLLSTLGVAVMSEVLVGAVEEAAQSFGINHLFVGVFLVALVGNAAEHSTAVWMGAKNKMDLALHIAVGSSIQVALFVAPVLVLAGIALHQPLSLEFSLLELVSVAIATAILALITLDGRCHWLEGVQLIALYIMLGVAFFLY